MCVCNASGTVAERKRVVVTHRQLDGAKLAVVLKRWMGRPV